MKIRKLVLSLCLFAFPAVASSSYIVAVPVADLRAEPQPPSDAAALKSPYDMDPLQETQLLFGEEVLVLEEKDAWVRVEAVEQPEYTHHEKWEGYPGWMEKKHLQPKPEGFEPNAVVVRRYARIYEGPSRKSGFMEIPLGARVQVMHKKGSWGRVLQPGQNDGWVRLKDLRGAQESPKEMKVLRRRILKTAKLFLGEPYFWGGRSGHRSDRLDRPSGVDCSGLVNLSYRANGVDIPRDAHEQYMKSTPVSYSSLKSGDLVFLAKAENPRRMSHVMIFIGGDRALESVNDADTVRRVTFKRKLGKRLKDIAPMEVVGNRIVFLGRLLPD
ncbi:MAG: C40 family peptidase [Elusimicrobia bacterium]|nr:C40 family peptidase [Elusimicrobiota bacterium]